MAESTVRVACCHVPMADVYKNQVQEPDDVMTQLVYGEPVRVLEGPVYSETGEESWARIRPGHYSQEGWVRADCLGKPFQSEWLKPQGGSFMQHARFYLGAPYKWGGLTRQGMDCSGLVHIAFRDAHGICLPRDSYEFELAGGQWVEAAGMLNGDVITYAPEGFVDDRPVHMAIYIGNGHILHASHEKGGVLEEYESASFKRRRRYIIRLPL